MLLFSCDPWHKGGEARLKTLQGDDNQLKDLSVLQRSNGPVNLCVQEASPGCFEQSDTLPAVVFTLQTAKVLSVVAFAVGNDSSEGGVGAYTLWQALLQCLLCLALLSKSFKIYKLW